MTTYYVSPAGSDGYSGLDLSHPWQTLTKVRDTVVAGDTTLFAPGNYTGGVQFNQSGTAQAPITLKSMVSWQGGIQPVSRGAVITEPNGAGLGTALLTLHGDYTILDGFELTGPDCQEGVFLYNSFGTVQNCWVHDICNSFDPGSAGGYGIGQWQDTYHASGAVIQGNRVERVGPKTNGVVQQNSFVHTIYVQVDNYAGTGVIQNNLAIQSSGWGIAIFHNPQNWLVTNNTVVKGITGGMDCRGDTSLGYFADHNTVQNNIFMECGDPSGTWFPAIWSPSDQCGFNNIFRNNLAYFPGKVAIYDFTPASSRPVQYASNLANADPQFVSYVNDGTGNYALLLSSPGVDTGYSVLAPAVDFAGTSRPQRAGYDVGAFEQMSSTGVFFAPFMAHR